MHIAVLNAACASEVQRPSYAALAVVCDDSYPLLLRLQCMRAYLEKPRTTVGWKGLINDPDLDGRSGSLYNDSRAERFTVSPLPVLIFSPAICAVPRPSSVLLCITASILTQDCV